MNPDTEWIDYARRLLDTLLHLDGRSQHQIRTGQIVSRSISDIQVVQGLLAMAPLSMGAAVQMVVHMVYFLHMNAKVEGGWSLLALVFTAALVLIMLDGSIWVMFHLNTNMMPMHGPQDMRVMP